MTNISKCEQLIRGGTVVDGSGSPRFVADIAIDGDRIVALGQLEDVSAEHTIDASGLIVAPGFIDAHTHDDRAVLSSPDMAAKTSQGVTSVVSGNCGISLAPLIGKEPPPPLNLLGQAAWFRFPTMDAYLSEVRSAPAALNIVPLVGHSTLRVGAMDRLDRPAEPAEIRVMQETLDAALKSGGIGLSTGLAYPTANAAPTEEVIALAKVAAAHGGVYATHMRDEREGVVESVRETIEIGASAEVPVVISHHKATGKKNWGLTKDTLALIAEARKRQRVDLDVYPYTASSTVLLEDFAAQSSKVLVTWSEPYPELAGRELSDIAKALGGGLSSVIARLQPAGAIYFQMDETDLQRVIQFEGAMIGSDGLPHDVHPHPRLWGTFARVLGHYSRGLGLLSLEEAVHRMSGKTAEVFGLADRGTLRVGAFADMVLFNAADVLDVATFAEPTKRSAGIERVYVNGQTVWADGRSTPARPGRVLRREPASGHA
ncbi:MAG: D-aminoacylase [Gammaproteobacteria bacterium]|nr:D-aminoacylase [Gammaproteobacteria bacterium]